MNKLHKTFAATVFAALVSFAANAADVTGTWTMSTESQQGAPRESTMTLTQKGSEVTGAIKTQRGENPVTGTITGNDLKLTQKLSFNGQEMTLEYTATVDGNAMTGSSKTPRGESKFTAKKQ